MVDRHGPIRTGQFIVEFDGTEVPGWRRVNIPSSSTEELEYQDGDPDGQTTLITTFQDLQMERAMGPGDDFITEWRDDHLSDPLEDVAKDIEITVLDEEHEELFSYKFEDAWIKYYNPPSLDVSDAGDISVEEVTLGFDSMEITHEG